MQKKPAVTPRQHDLSGTDLFRRAAFDLDHLTRPKSGQHAFPVNAQTQTTASTQSVRHQCGTCRTPAQACRAWVIFQHQEVFLEEAE